MGVMFWRVKERHTPYHMHFVGSRPCCKPTRLARVESDEYRIVARLPSGAHMSIPIGRVPLDPRRRSA
jgi:hypothetical protein